MTPSKTAQAAKALNMNEGKRRTSNGRAAHVPTDARKARVAKLVGFGIAKADIASMLEISEDTLRKYYARELAVGVAQTNATVITALYHSAVKRNSVPAQIYWTKSRAGWRDTLDVNVTTEPNALHLLAAQAISDRLALERGDAPAPTIDGHAIVDDDTPPRE